MTTALTLRFSFTERQGKSCMRKEYKKRLLAWLMAIVLLAGNMPLSVFASSVDEETVQTVETQPEEEKTKPETVTKPQSEVTEPEEETKPEVTTPEEEKTKPEAVNQPQPEENKQPEAEGESMEEAETPQMYTETKISVLYSDVENIAKRRELDGNKLLEVYADGVKMKPQPEITLDSEKPEEMSGVQVYTYTIHNLSIYRTDSAEKVEYTVKEKKVLKGYAAFTGKALKGADETQTETILGELAAPDDEVKLVTGEKEHTLKADKKFGNYLPAYEVSGTVNWKPADAKVIHPDMESYFQNQFQIVRDGEKENYTSFKIHYTQSDDNADSWNFTVEGLFTTKEDGSKISYTLKAGEADGYAIEQPENTVAEDNYGLEFTYVEKEVKEVPKAKAAMREAAGTTSESLTINWVDNNNIDRPKPEKLEEYVHIRRKVGEDGFWEDTSENVTCQTVGMQTIFKSGQLPTETENGEAISYQIVVDYAKIEGYMHLTEDGKEYLIKQTTFSGDIVLRYGEDSSKTEDEIADALEEVLQLSATYNGDNELKGDDYFVGVKESLKITGDDGKYQFAYTVPEFVTGNHEIIWKLNAPDAGEVFGSKYVAEYDNKNASNHGQETDACYQEEC